VLLRHVSVTEAIKNKEKEVVEVAAAAAMINFDLYFEILF
jgi:hypothetical protein